MSVQRGTDLSFLLGDRFPPGLAIGELLSRCNDIGFVPPLDRLQNLEFVFEVRQCGRIDRILERLDGGKKSIDFCIDGRDLIPPRIPCGNGSVHFRPGNRLRQVRLLGGKQRIKPDGGFLHPLDNALSTAYDGRIELSGLAPILEVPRVLPSKAQDRLPEIPVLVPAECFAGLPDRRSERFVRLTEEIFVGINKRAVCEGLAAEWACIALHEGHAGFKPAFMRDAAFLWSAFMCGDMGADPAGCRFGDFIDRLAQQVPELCSFRRNG